MAMRIGELPRTTASIGASTVVEMMTGFLANKVVALMTGPTGIAILAQIAGLQGVALLIAGLGMPASITLHVADADGRKDLDALGRTLATGVLLPIAGGIFLALALMAWAGPLSQLLLHSNSAADLVRIGALGVLFSVVYKVGDGAFQGLRVAGTSSLVRIVSAIVSLGVAVSLTVRMGVRGAVLGLSLQAAITAGCLLVFFVPALRHRGLQWQHCRLDRALFTHMARIGLAVLMALAASSAGTVWIRSLVVHSLDLGSAGLFQSAWALTAQLYTVSITVLMFYTYPRVCAAANDKSRISIINDSLAFAILLITAGNMILLVLREFALVLVFRGDFENAKSLLPLLALGTLYATALWPVATPMLPKGRLVPYVILTVTSALFFPFVASLLFPELGLMAIGIAYFVSNAIGFVIYVFDERHSIGFRISRENAALLLASTLAIGAQALVVDRAPAAIAFRFALAAGWLLLAVCLARCHLVRLGVLSVVRA